MHVCEGVYAAGWILLRTKAETLHSTAKRVKHVCGVADVHIVQE